MDEVIFNKRAKSHLKTLFLWFSASLIIAAASFEIRYWADHMHGWQIQVISVLFTILMLAGAFGLFYFGVSIYSWFKEYKVTLSDSKSLTSEELERIHSGVIGPIKWK